MPVKDFAYWLGKLILEVRKRDGHEYPPMSLYALVCCFKRHFELSGVHDINPLSPDKAVFGDFRITLDAEMKRLHASGLVVRTKQAEPIYYLMRRPSYGPKASLEPTMPKSLPIPSTSTIVRYLVYPALTCIRTSFVSSSVRRSTKNPVSTLIMGTRQGEVGWLKLMKVKPKVICQYEDVSDPDHCVVNIFLTYLLYAPRDVDYFYCCALPDD